MSFDCGFKSNHIKIGAIVLCSGILFGMIHYISKSNHWNPLIMSLNEVCTPCCVLNYPISQKFVTAADWEIYDIIFLSQCFTGFTDQRMLKDLGEFFKSAAIVLDHSGEGASISRSI